MDMNDDDVEEIEPKTDEGRVIVQTLILWEIMTTPELADDTFARAEKVAQATFDQQDGLVSMMQTPVTINEDYVHRLEDDPRMML